MKKRGRKKKSKENLIDKLLKSEDANNPDLVYKMFMARLRLSISDTASESLIWLIRLLIRSHPDPRRIIDFAIENFDDYRTDLELVKIVMENELAVKYGEK